MQVHNAGFGRIIKYSLMKGKPGPRTVSLSLHKQDWPFHLSQPHLPLPEPRGTTKTLKGEGTLFKFSL